MSNPSVSAFKPNFNANLIGRQIMIMAGLYKVISIYRVLSLSSTVESPKRCHASFQSNKLSMQARRQAWVLQFFLVLEAGETSTIDIIDDLMRFFEKVAATTIFLLVWLNFSKFYGSQCLAGIALPASHQTCQEVILKTFFIQQF